MKKLLTKTVRFITSVVYYKQYKGERSYVKRYRLKDGTYIFQKREGKVEFKRSFVYLKDEKQADKFSEKKAKEFKKSKYDTFSISVQAFKGRIKDAKYGTVIGQVGKAEKMFAVKKKKLSIVSVRNSMITNISIATDNLKAGSVVYLRRQKEVRRKL